LSCKLINIPPKKSQWTTFTIWVFLFFPKAQTITPKFHQIELVLWNSLLRCIIILMGDWFVEDYSWFGKGRSKMKRKVRTERELRKGVRMKWGNCYVFFFFFPTCVCLVSSIYYIIIYLFFILFSLIMERCFTFFPP
jgi:hypothetical protein